MTLTVEDIERHLQEQDLTASQQSELLFFRDAALQLIALHPDLRPEVLPLDTDQPLMRFAVLELIRDMNQTQSGAGGRTFGQDFEPDAVVAFSAGRPTLPPYVEGLLSPYLRRASSDGPIGSFPAAQVWPAWCSTIPAAIDALLSAVRAQVPAGVHVVDGFPRFKLVDISLIAVGGTAEPTASGDQSPEDMGGGRMETYALRLRTSCSRGIGTEQKVVRDAAFELVDHVDAALQDDPTLGGVVHLAEIGGTIDLLQTEAESADLGTHAEVAFTVLVQGSV